ncbi:hypothetical protein [Flavobacterium sp. LS1P3]|jgi:hypothetical protein|uniref:hypothetical protein n=1 Tax=Flavobacterium sp. LS1P3 TaxID=3401720 RepID=UPI003AABC903
MKKNYFFFIVFLLSYQAFSQEIYFKTGKNFTKYDYRDSSGQSNSYLQSGVGNFFEVGISNPLHNKFSYAVGFSLDDYNAIGDYSNISYSWDTKYLGINSELNYSVLPSSIKNINFFLQIGLKGSTIIYGKQGIDGVYYDLVKHKEFSGLVLVPHIGFLAKYNIPSFGSLSVGYNYSKSLYNSNVNGEKLSFETNHIQLGIHFNINGK